MHNNDLRFRIIARRDTLFAHQAAEQLTLSEHTAAAPVTAPLKLRDGSGHDGLLIRYRMDVFAEHCRAEPSDGLFRSLDVCGASARQQLLAHPDSN